MGVLHLVVMVSSREDDKAWIKGPSRDSRIKDLLKAKTWPCWKAVVWDCRPSLSEYLIKSAMLQKITVRLARTLEEHTDHT